jgi:hypothetical protein
MFEYVENLNLDWHEGRVKRTVTDHIQIHHTVGDYDTPERWTALHNKRVASSDYRGIEYSFGINSEGRVFEGRGLEYKHGGVMNSLTNNANDRSVSVVFIGDMRKPELPSDKQMQAGVILVRDLLAYYKLAITDVYGHNEIKPYRPGDSRYTLCPVIDMDDFRLRLDAGITFPSGYYYGGASYVNLRTAPDTLGTIIGRVNKNDDVIVLDIDGGWAEVIKHNDVPMKRGYCISTWLKRR